MTPRQQRNAWAGIVVLGVLLPFAPAVLGLRTLSFRDTEQLYAPIRTLVVEELRAGRLPLWNPYEGTGKPLFAEGIHSVLHPLSLLAAFAAPSSIDFLILSYLVAAALGAFLLARTLDASGPASAGAALAFAFSGYSVSMTGNLVFLAGLSTLPWLLAAARSAGGDFRWGSVLTALATAAAFFSGDVQVTIVGLVLGLLLAADAGGPRGAARALAGFVAGILLAGVQILSSWGLLPHTNRALQLSDFEKTRWPLPIGRLVELVLPGLYRGSLDEVPTNASGGWLDHVFSESVYLGAPLLVAAMIALARYRRRTATLLALSALVLLWLSMGNQLGARQLLDWVPVWSRFRYTEKLVAPLALCLAALAAVGIDRFGKEQLSKRMKYALLAFALTAATLLLVGRIAPEASSRLTARLLGDVGPFFRTTFLDGLPHLSVALAALVAIDRIGRETSRAVALALLVAAAPAAAIRQGAHMGTPEARAIVTPPVLETDAPTPRIGHPSERIAGAGERADYFERAARYHALVLLTPINVALRMDAMETYGAFEPSNLTALSTSNGESWMRRSRRFGLSHLFLPVPLNVIDRESTLRATEGGSRVPSNPNLPLEIWAVPHRPWAFFAERALPVERREDALAAVLHLMDQEEDATVVVETRQAPPTGSGRVLRTARGTEVVRIEAESRGTALLVIQDAWWPGWRASIDGQTVEILTADSLVRAVRWPPGRHTLEMTYSPPELRAGIAVSALGLLTLLVGAIRALRRDRSSGPIV